MPIGMRRFFAFSAGHRNIWGPAVKNGPPGGLLQALCHRLFCGIFLVAQVL